MKKLIFLLCLTTSVAWAQKTYKINDKVQDFSLKNIDGNMIGMKDFPEAKGFILVFTCNHCPFSQAYEERIKQLDLRYKSQGYPVIAINPNDPAIVPEDSYDAMIQRAKEYNYTFPYLVDETQEIAKMFGATRTPHVFIVSKEKKSLILSYIGAIDNNRDDGDKADQKYVENALGDLLGGKKPEVSETKALGCTIKWRK